MFGAIGIPELIIVGILGIPATAVYFVPTIVAYAGRKRSRVGILLLNLFAGWTGIGWVGAMIWAVVNESERAAPPAAVR
jgi:Superinfection immunity protein